jgi:ribosomal-protein-alanine N-acetyltransferase
MATTLRAFKKSDLPAVMPIEQAAHISPWARETFETCFRSGCKGWLIENDGEVVAFVVVSLHADECHVLNLCVRLQHQRQGLGKELLAHALQYAKSIGIAIAYLEVRRSNTRAISLYRQYDFQLIGERKDYYSTVNGNEDALIFAKNLKA